MTTVRNRPNTALLVLDVRNGAVEGAHERDAVVANVGSPNLCWAHQTAPGRTAGTVETKDVDFGGAS